jgi:alanine racemase
MDLTGVDVTDVPGVSVGVDVVVMGKQGTRSLDARDLADAANTLPYEVLTNVSRRVPRFYVD